MNVNEVAVLNELMNSGFSSQRNLAKNSGLSLGSVNQSLRTLYDEKYIDENNRPTDEAFNIASVPQTAIILAAGFGVRMVPINTEIPKALLKVNGEVLIERLITQLKEKGIDKIYIVVGFMKEQFEYLIDEFNVELIVNSEYAVKNNLHSLKKAINYLEDAYIVPCDIWCKENPFRTFEISSWYMVTDKQDIKSQVRINRRMELQKTGLKEIGNQMVGISYITGNAVATIKSRINELCSDPEYNSAFWEQALYEDKKMIINARRVSDDSIIEINTYEQLRDADMDSENLKTDAIDVICNTFGISPDEITNISTMKKGMTNRSFMFNCKEKTYIMRIPGEGTENLINRAQEAQVYGVINNRNICDRVMYINPENGYKITEFVEGAHNCNPDDQADLVKCMKKLREFHEMKLEVAHEFNIFDQIEFYESLWKNEKSVYGDYIKTKNHVLELKTYIDSCKKDRVLTHIDAVNDNFLLIGDEVKLIDWEYAGMQDPHVDLAMFSIYAFYNKDQVDNLINIYFDNKCSLENRIKIYCYIAACGLLWSNWCEYKRQLGVEFGEYSLRQYRYAKEFYKVVQNELRKGE